MPEITTLKEIQESTGFEKFLEDYYSDRNKEKLTAFLKSQQITTGKFDERDISLLLNALVTGSCMLEMTHVARLDLERNIRKYFELFKGSWSKRLDIIMEDEIFLRWLLHGQKIDIKSFKEGLLQKKEELDAEKSKLDKEYGSQRAGNIKGIREYFHQIVRQLDNMDFGQSQQIDFIFNLLIAFEFEWNAQGRMDSQNIKDNIRVSIQQPIIRDSKREFDLVFEPD
jgi:hypothetical protein|tara:strand:+ start:271 stop:948 length:678 start_codon:yes stop_codon:yes gene_type:complete